MGKRILKGVIVLLVLLLIGGVFIYKRTTTGDINAFQQNVDAAAHNLQSDRESLEIEDFTAEMIKTNEKPMIIVMGESWCQPCLKMIPDLRELSVSVDDITIKYLDLEKNPEAFNVFPIRVTPTIAVYLENGVPFTPPEGSAIDYILYTYKDTGEHAITIHEGMLTRSQLDMMIEDIKVILDNYHIPYRIFCRD